MSTSEFVPGAASAVLPGPRAILRRARWMAVAAGIGLGGGIALDVVRTPVYESTAYVTVTSADSGQTGNAPRSAQALARLATSPGIIGGPLRAEGLAEAAADPRAYIRVQAAPDAPIVSVTGRSTEAAAAQRTAVTVGETLVALDAVEPFETSLVAVPPVPEAPTVPAWLAPAGGAGVGAAVGLLLAATVPVGTRRRTAAGEAS